MAHEVITVCLPPTDVEAIHDEVARAMAPFDMNGDHDPWQGQWDAWGLGRGKPFAVRPGAETDPRLIRVEDNAPAHSRRQPLPPSLCDGGPRRLLDLDTRRGLAAAKARDEWRTWHEFARAFPPARTMEELRREFNAAHGPGPDARFRGRFEEQEVIRAVEGQPHVLALAAGMWDPVAQFADPEDAHVRRARSLVNTTDHLLTLDGQWLEAGADVFTERPETYGDSYVEFADEYLLGLPDDCYLIRVRFHG
ncbi:hypothetical protein ACSHWO_37470 (plasmid) [Streptomyces sp. HUAS TT3]|uniref:hypothetical protein n=1 Tax=Streptomyces sp. HUAS TT3 TaxID=3447510 RepID=UPI003F655E7D